MTYEQVKNTIVTIEKTLCNIADKKNIDFLNRMFGNPENTIEFREDYEPMEITVTNIGKIKNYYTASIVRSRPSDNFEWFCECKYPMKIIEGKYSIKVLERMIQTNEI